ncbi:MAG: metallophosphatase domain-containing protein [Bradymonadaceae bacterium]|nr:metallophosphatase domain-containing protein [Lujinxingiaceae bacterium]
MRIVAVADTHTFEEDLQVPNGDVFIHAGDLLRAGTLEELILPARWLQSLPHRHKIVVAGNHDRCFERNAERAQAMLGDGIHYLQDSGVVIEGLRIWGSPWQPEFNDWAFNLPRGEALARKWALIPDDTDVLVTHGPPAGFGDRAYDDRGLGCQDLLDAVRRVRPLLHVYGHVHPGGGCWRDGDSWLSNVTVWECDRPASIFDYDPATRVVTPVFIPPAEYDATR